MIVELITEQKIAKEAYYEVQVDGSFVTGSYDLEKATSLYELVLEEIKIGKKDNKIVLKSEEIIVDL
jgi:hypothetical protein